MPIACLLVPSLALACELAAHPGLAGRPAVLADEVGLRVVELTAAAARRGVRAGATLREAVAYCPALAVLEPHPARVARASDALIEAIEVVSPIIEEAEPGVIYADLAGMEGLYPRPGMVEAAVFEAVPAALRPRLGIAEQRFTAYAAARSVAPGEALRVARGEERALLDPRPTSWLPLEPADRAQLHLLGIETIGAFAALPRHAIEAQFGISGGRAWLAARGEDPTPLRPRPFSRERVREHAQAQPPLVSREAVLHTAEQLLSRAMRQPQALRRFVRCVRLRATTDDDRLWERTQTMKEPTGSRERLWTTLRPLLELAEYPGPISELELELGGLTSESGRQPGLFRDHARRREQLDEMVRHLKVRFGETPIARVVALEPWSRIPERRHALMDYDP